MRYPFMQGWTTQRASDVDRDGLGFELVDAGEVVVAEVFRSDRLRTLQFSLFRDGLPFTVIEWFVDQARGALHSFEDETPLPEPIA